MPPLVPPVVIPPPSYPFPPGLNDSLYEQWQTVPGLLRQIIKLLGGAAPVTNPVVNGLSVFTLTVGTTFGRIVGGKVFCRWGIVQNVSNSLSDVITVASDSSAAGGHILNPPSSISPNIQGGGSYPFASPDPRETFDLSSIFVKGTAATDKIAVSYI